MSDELDKDFEDFYTPEELKSSKEIQDEIDRLEISIQKNQEKGLKQKGGGRPKVQRVVFPMKRKRGGQRKTPKPVGRPPVLIKIHDTQAIIKKMYFEIQKRDQNILSFMDRGTRSMEIFCDHLLSFIERQDEISKRLDKLEKIDTVRSISDKNYLLLFDIISLDIKRRGFCDLNDWELRACLSKNDGDLLNLLETRALVNKLIEDKKFTNEIYYVQDDNGKPVMCRKLHLYFQ